jgi:predicted acylesterase/phospholipase RssA
MSNLDTSLKIGLGLSGGGFRASSFSLGVLTYLAEVKLEEGTTLLDNVVVLSTVSGGTICGASYAIGLKQGKSLVEIYKVVYNFMIKKDLVALSLDRLIFHNLWKGERVKGLITAFADNYDQHLFNKAKFGLLMKGENPIHLKNVIFNATEFDNANQFRFQWTESKNEQGIIGNYFRQIPAEIAEQIRMADILAASSCFPGGFEPINFPDDFVFEKPEEIKFDKSKGFPVGLMDGGIIDNQGIEGLLMVEERMRKNRDGKNPNPERALDLIILSDVTSPYMEEYKVSIQKKSNWWRKLTPLNVILINTLVMVLSGYFLLQSYLEKNILILLISNTGLLISIFLYFIIGVFTAIPNKLGVPAFFMKSLRKLSRIRFQVYENLISNRVNSLLKLNLDVFLKHIRRLNYARIYESKHWHNRSIMNAIYELRPQEEKLNKKIQEGKISPHLIPTEEIRAIAQEASEMGTTLWFSEVEKSEQTPQKIIICGQLTMCWNLLEYLEILKKDTTNTNIKHQTLMNCEEQILKHWEAFKKNPLWLVEKYKG